jgi:hypothetical protein
LIDAIITTAPLPLNIRKKIICALINHHHQQIDNRAATLLSFSRRRVEGDRQ